MKTCSQTEQVSARRAAPHPVADELQAQLLERDLAAAAPPRRRRSTAITIPEPYQSIAEIERLLAERGAR